MIKLKIVMPNLYEVMVGDIIVWFSYTTPIAFKVGLDNILISENIWTKTTGKHINYVKTVAEYTEVPYEEFNNRCNYINF